MDDANPAPLESCDILAYKFEKRGYKQERIHLGDRSYVRFTGNDGWTWLTPYTFVSYPMTTYAAIKICATKAIAYQYAASQGASIPRTLALSTASPADVSAFLKSYAPLVVKPVRSHGSIGVTLEVDSTEKLSRAIQDAKMGDKDILLQQQFTGEEVRLTILRGKVISAILRQTPRVVGDGTSTIAELIARENEARTALVFDYLSYPQLEGLVADEYMRSTEVPSEGQVIELGKSTMVRGGASLYDITDTIHDSYKQTAVRLASQLNPEFLVVDMMLADYTAHQTDDNYVFIEFNTSPSLKLYYAVRDGKAYDMAAALVDAIIDRVRFTAL